MKTNKTHSFCLATVSISGSNRKQKPRRLYLAATEAGSEGEVERLAWMELVGAAISIARCVVWLLVWSFYGGGGGVGGSF